ncbi:MAG TPA: AAA family ATPase, partial [Polyangiaceae bacterium]|nr:AAA family ATPase [Polyangiaceae bacterium]
MLLEDYELEEVIAKSSRTVVQRARRKSDGLSVVIKSPAQAYPSASAVGQLEFEYRILQRLQSPGVIRAIELARDGHRVAIVLEDFDGQSPPALARGDGQLAGFFAIAIGAAVALGDVHAQGVIHKDVKPKNLLVNAATRALKLIDFHSATERTSERNVELAHQFEGSLPYMSPEQTGRMNRDLDYRADYYSLGVTYFELLTGVLPFAANDVLGWVHCHLSKAVPDPRSINPTIPEPLARIVMKLMAKDPDQRYQSSEGLLGDLRRCEAHWQAHHAIPSFVLGERDVSERFHTPTRLVGRERECAELLEIFEHASTGAARLLLVAGSAGVGKSSLIHEIQGALVLRRGHFVAGKFDQLARHMPYAALLQALGGLVEGLLAESEERLSAWQQWLGAALGPNGQVLVELIPELEQIIGQQPALAQLSPREARERLQQVVRAFIRALARPEHPLVIFVDDLQWTDASTAELLVHLLEDESLRHLLIIGAYRDNEVDEEHLLGLALAKLRAARPEVVRQIRLEPLSPDSVHVIVASTVLGPPELSRPLADLVSRKTDGNPFFVNELLRMLNLEGAFRFVRSEGRWEWQLERIAQARFSDNVVDLMVERLNRLPAATLELLPIGACLGAEFELASLVHVVGRPPGALALALWEAVRADVLVPVGSSYRLVSDGTEYDRVGLQELAVRYRFQHDRVQQAAYSLLGAEQRARTHVEIGRLLQASLDPREREARTFEIVNHLNLGRSHIQEVDDRVALAEQNRQAAERAKRAAAFQIANQYLECALGLLSPEEWAAQPALRFQSALLRAECIFNGGDVERASGLCDELLATEMDPMSKAAAYLLKARVLEHEAKNHDAIAFIRRGLSCLGLNLPESPAEIGAQIKEGIGKMQGHLARTPIDELTALPELEDPTAIMTMQLLFKLIVPAIQVQPPLFILSELILFDMALTRGATAISCKNFVDCGILQGGVLGDSDRAYRLGKLAFAMLNRYAPTPLEAPVNFVFGAFLSHWCAPHKEGVGVLRHAQRVAAEMGDVQYVAYARAFELQHLLMLGHPLAECHAEVERAVSYLIAAQVQNPLAGSRAVQRVVAKLHQTLEDPEASQRADELVKAQLVSMGNTQWLYSYSIAQTWASFLLRDLRAAAAWDEITRPQVNPGNVMFVSTPDHYLLRTLLLARRAQADAAEARPEETEEARASRVAEMDANLEKLRQWAERVPENFMHKYKLAAAEVARSNGAPLDTVLELYEAAVTATGEDFLPFRALAHELQGELWLARQKTALARASIREAHHLYRRWSATAKLEQLERHYPGWLEQSAPDAREAPGMAHSETRRGAAASLDVESIVKATQAISSEVKPERLFAALMATIIENAGAERGCLVLKAESGPDLVVVARAHVGAELDDAQRNIPLAQCAELCPEIVRYVARSKDAVVLDDASKHERYRNDAYVQRDGVKSILCLPVLHQGNLIALLYAENNAVAKAFTSDRMQLLNVIAGQAAISIANARLYDQLEMKVTERTRALVEKNQEVEVMLNNIQQGVFTIDEQLAIQPQYSAHLEELLGARDIRGKDCLKMLFAGADLSDELINTTNVALQFSFGAPEAAALVNAPYLVREFRRGSAGNERHFEVDWNFISDERGNVYKILVALRDVTLLRNLHEAMAKKTRELDMVGQVLEAGLPVFERSCAASRELLRDCLRILNSGPELRAGALAELFRNLHTVKGNARAVGATLLTERVHHAEQAHVELRARPDA